MNKLIRSINTSDSCYLCIKFDLNLSKVYVIFVKVFVYSFWLVNFIKAGV